MAFNLQVVFLCMVAGMSPEGRPKRDLTKLA